MSTPRALQPPTPPPPREKQSRYYMRCIYVFSYSHGFNEAANVIIFNAWALMLPKWSLAVTISNYSVTYCVVSHFEKEQSTSSDLLVEILAPLASLNATGSR